MKIQIELLCPNCQNANIVKNGEKSYGNKQNHLCKDCGRQFIAEHELDYRGCERRIFECVKRAFVRGCGIRDIAEIFGISTDTVLSFLKRCKFTNEPSKKYYDSLEIDEFWSFVGEKKQKCWLIYAYHRESGEIVAWVFGKRNLLTAKKLRKRIKELGLDIGKYFMDNWRSFKRAFKGLKCIVGKEGTKGIEGNNCRLRHRIRRAFRRSCNFSKKEENHIIAFEMAFHYINVGYI
jgi:IS1 family transposase/transposase-like protein